MEDRVADNVRDVRRRIEAAARRSGRDPSDVRMVAVTKYFPPGDRVHEALVAAGCRDFGESRPRRLHEKASLDSPPSVQWHLIGHLQRNKVRMAAPHVAMIHPIDSERLLDAVDRFALESASSDALRLLLEVNISGDATKHGFTPRELIDLAPTLSRFDSVEICGLMAMGGLESDPGEVRRQFAAVRELRDRLAPLVPEPVQLAELSMGMSGDFETAVEEGATLVRVGSVLYEGIDQ